MAIASGPEWYSGPVVEVHRVLVQETGVPSSGDDWRSVRAQCAWFAGRTDVIMPRRLAGRRDVGFTRSSGAHVVPAGNRRGGITPPKTTIAQLREPVAHRRDERRLLGVDDATVASELSMTYCIRRR
jgi:hypothetical protein